MRLIHHPAFSSVMRKVNKVMQPYTWCLIGGRAVEVWSNPPQTPDCDILYYAQDVRGVDIIDAFESSRSGIRLNDNYKEGDVIFMLDIKEDVEIDIIPTWDSLNLAMIMAADNQTVGGVSMPVATPEDLVMMKAQILADAKNGSNARDPEKLKRDRATIKILAKSKDLDWDYIVKSLNGEGWHDELDILRNLKVAPPPRRVK